MGYGACAEAGDLHGVGGFQAVFGGDAIFRLLQWLLNGYALPYSKGSLKNKIAKQTTPTKKIPHTKKQPEKQCCTFRLPQKSISHYFANFSNAATAGNSLPSKNSKNAPPPVEI